MRTKVNPYAPLNYSYSIIWNKLFYLFIYALLVGLSTLSAQVKTQVDTTAIRIGEQIKYKIEVEADTTALVVFPEGQTFLPLEAVEASEIDSLNKTSSLFLSRIYKLTQFDSGYYTIPRQKILIDDKVHYTDSIRVEVQTIVVDTTKQKLYDIKPIIDVDKSGGNWWKWLLGILLTLGLIALILYWFIWRKKPLTEEEEIALLPPYERAKLGLQKLDEKNYLKTKELKPFYSELTFVLRKFLDEKVYDRAMESTTDELVDRLQLLKDGNQFPFTKETISNIETVLKRADLVKFAKSAPDIALAEMDKATFEKEIDHIKSCLPEPSEEEKLLDLEYKKAQERKEKRRKTIITAAISVLILALVYSGFSIKYGFGYVNDTIFGDDSKNLLEGDWVKSAYGFPPIWIETPEVLRRLDSSTFDVNSDDIETTLFAYGNLESELFIQIGTSKVKKAQAKTEDEQKALNMTTIVEGNLKDWEQKGVQNILTKTDKYTTPNGAEGLKTFGTAEFPLPNTSNKAKGNYAIYSFTTKAVIQQIVLVWRQDNDYADNITNRIINSIELIPDELAKEEEN